MRISYKHLRKRSPDDSPTTSISGIGAASTMAPDVSLESTDLVTNTRSVPGAAATPLTYSIALSAVPTITSSAISLASSSASASPSASPAADVSTSTVPLGTVIGACIGAFAGLILVILLFYLYSKRSVGAAARDSRGARGENWKKLGEGEDAVPTPPSKDSSREMEEKNRSLFKKSSPSIRTFRTKFSDDDHGFGLPPFEFSKYHPNLAQELALEKPTRPFAGASAQRSDSGVSWDGSTVHDDSFLSMRSVRMDSGTMSPTMVMAKTTPAATSLPEHKWESAEVLTMEQEDVSGPKEVQNPFADVTEQRRSVANPFFNAQELQRKPTHRTRSRSNSRSGRTRSVSDTVRQSRVSNPFADVQEVPVYRVSPPEPAHLHDSVASGASAAVFGEHAMKSLIAALELSQEEVEERLRVVSMQGSTNSRFSTMTGDTDIATVRQFPMPPSSAETSPYS